jgi:hypothetical protein
MQLKQRRKKLKQVLQRGCMYNVILVRISLRCAVRVCREYSRMHLLYFSPINWTPN